MEKVSILTSHQQQILDKISKSTFLTSNFYFTGGTVLSEFYLKHRQSEDLDFFSESRFEFNLILQEINKWSKELNFTFTRELKEVVDIYILTFRDKGVLKLDFGYYPYPRVEKGGEYQGITVDSQFDIAINKLAATNQRSSVKDFVDLYFAMDEVGCDFEQLIKGMKEKYEMDFSKTDLLARLPIVKDLVDYPKMLIPFDPKKMENFFLKLAKDREGEIFK